MIQIRVSGEFLLLPVKVTPKSGRDAVLPYSHGDTTVKIKVSALPEDGRANTAVIQLLSKTLDLPKSRIEIHQGEKSRNKQVRIRLQDNLELLLAKFAIALDTAPESFIWIETI
jgi:uncharacterized protein (TIGR00251 family)